MAIFSIIPTTPSENQTFSITLSNVTYKFTLIWLESPDEEAGWMLSIQDTSTNNFIVSNIPLVSGVDLFAQLRYLNFGGYLILSNILPPDFNALGNGVDLVYVTQ